MEKEEHDSVSNIHKRWSLTRINFSSYKISLAISVISCVVIIALWDFNYLGTQFLQFLTNVTIGTAFLITSYFLDQYLLRNTPVNKISKVLHVSGFSNLLWMFIMIFGLLAFLVFQKDTPPKGYLLEGMMLAIGLRIGIFTSVFGAEIIKAIQTAIIQPIIILLIITPIEILKQIWIDPLPILFGLSLISLSILWVIFADRSGKPQIQSTFALLQAFLSAWTENKVERIEKILVSRSKNHKIFTDIIRFTNYDNNEIEAYIVLPDIHPGPFKSIGGSNLPYRLYEYFSRKAVIFHAISDHSLNIPSMNEVMKYLRSLEDGNKIESGRTCSRPIQIRVGKATATGLIFGRVPVIMLSNAPQGMEDIPVIVKKELHVFSKEEGFHKIFLVDSHNAMGGHIDQSNIEDLLSSGKQCLKKLKELEQYEFKISIANTYDLADTNDFSDDIGKSGFTVLLIEVNHEQYFIGWADANNMKNCVREKIIEKLGQNGIQMLEICTSDTHENSGFRTSEGYYPLGRLTNTDSITDYYYHIALLARKKIEKSEFKIINIESLINVMGKDQFNDYSEALDRGMYLTKIFLSLTFGIILIMLIFTK